MRVFPKESVRDIRKNGHFLAIYTVRHISQQPYHWSLPYGDFSAQKKTISQPKETEWILAKLASSKDHTDVHVSERYQMTWQVVGKIASDEMRHFWETSGLEEDVNIVTKWLVLLLQSSRNWPINSCSTTFYCLETLSGRHLIPRFISSNSIETACTP